MDPSAFFMNLLKHHGLHLKKLVANWAEGEMLPKNEELNKIGGSQMDLYLGNLQPHEIFQELSENLRKKEIHLLNDFIHWVQPKDYRILNCSDESRWILRLKNEDRLAFIHLHPARHSPFSIRIKASTLKTTLWAATYSKIQQRPPDLALVNKFRSEILSLSPTREISWDQKIFTFLIGSSIPSPGTH